ncbi:hypothetical protein D1872_312280 [compost metagenome]
MTTMHRVLNRSTLPQLHDIFYFSVYTLLNAGFELHGILNIRARLVGAQLSDLPLIHVVYYQGPRFLLGHYAPEPLIP